MQNDDWNHKHWTRTARGASREPSEPPPPSLPPQSITNALKTSLIDSRGIYSVPQHQSTLVFHSCYRPGPIGGGGGGAVPASGLFQGKSRRTLSPQRTGNTHIVLRDKRANTSEGWGVGGGSGGLMGGGLQRRVQHHEPEHLEKSYYLKLLPCHRSHTKGQIPTVA